MKWLTTILLLGSLYGQGFGYNYIDPCNQQAVNLNYKTETTENGFLELYYNQRRFFFTWFRSRRNITELDTTSLPRF